MFEKVCVGLDMKMTLDTKKLMLLLFIDYLPNINWSQHNNRIIKDNIKDNFRDIFKDTFKDIFKDILMDNFKDNLKVTFRNILKDMKIKWLWPHWIST